MQSVKRPKKVTALTKHRKWLQDLQKTKDELEQKYIQDMDQKRETQEKVNEGTFRDVYFTPRSSPKYQYLLVSE